MNRQTGDVVSGGVFLRRATPATVVLPEYGLYVLESHHASGFEMAMGDWPFHKVCWVPMGRGILETGVGSVPIRRDDVLVIPERVEHRFVDEPTEPMTLVMVCFGAEVTSPSTALGRVFARVEERFAPCRPLRSTNAFQREEIRACFRFLLHEQSRAAVGFEASIHAGTIGLLVRLLRGCESAERGGRGDRERDLDGVLDFLDSRFNEPVQLPAMARRCGLSPRRFSQVFRQRTGRSLIEYVNVRRIAHAKERLRETGHIAYACHESGFQDMAYFYRMFRKHTGLTPEAFVKAANGD